MFNYRQVKIKGAFISYHTVTSLTSPAFKKRAVDPEKRIQSLLDMVKDRVEHGLCNLETLQTHLADVLQVGEALEDLANSIHLEGPHSFFQGNVL